MAGIVRTAPVVGAATSVDELAVFNLVHEARYAAVEGERFEILGFVSLTDVVREHVLEGQTHDTLARAFQPSRGERPGEGFRIELVERRTAHDIMMPFFVTLELGATIAEAAAVMAARGVDHVAVVLDGHMVGVVDARDVLRELARQLGVAVVDDPDEPARRACEHAL